jgi:predicted nucleotidyltransferase
MVMLMETSEAKRSERAIHPSVIELREMLQSELGDNFLRLYHYGSRVEGGADADSDFDVLCVTKRPVSRQQRDKIIYRQLDIQMARDVLFDLHYYSEEQLQTPPLSFTPYVQHVTTEGVVV